MGEPIELRSPIPVETPLGRGWAIIYDPDTTESWWTVILSDTRAFVTFPQSKIYACRSYTWGRDVSNEQMQEFLAPGALPKKRAPTNLARGKNLASSPRKDTARREVRPPHRRTRLTVKK